MIIDTHCHYNLEALFGEDGQNWQKHWQTAQEHGVSHSIVIGTNITTSARAVELCRLEPHFRASVGFHPHAIDDALEQNQPVSQADIAIWLTHLQALLEKDSTTHSIAAVGEVGLDYFRLDLSKPEDLALVELQKYLLTEQVKLAERALLPLILHVRDTGTQAYDDTLHILKQYKKSNLPFVLHCASGSMEYIQEALAMGAYIGIAGNVTYKNADSIREIVKIVPADRLLLETDAPYLPPQPHRGKLCEPWMIELTATYLKENCTVSLDQVYSNSFQVFTSLPTL